MTCDIREWTRGIADQAAGFAKRAVGEFTARPDLVLDGERQQARGRAEAAEAAPEGEFTAGWKLSRDQRAELLARFPPKHAFTIADHVTLRAKVAEDSPLPPERAATIVGHVDDGLGVEAMIVAVDGNTERPDGGTYHITWSLGPERRASQSNDVIAERGWKPLPEPVAIALHPAVFR